MQTMKMKTMVQNLQDATKAILREKFITIQAYFKKQENFEITCTKRARKKERIKSKLKEHGWTQMILC